MKSLNLLTVFTRPSIFSAAMSVAVVFAFVSSASAGEKNFDVLSGVTAEALTLAAMDEVQGAGFVRIINRAGIIRKMGTGASFSMTIDLRRSGSAKRSTCPGNCTPP